MDEGGRRKEGRRRREKRQGQKKSRLNSAQEVDMEGVSKNLEQAMVFF